MCGIAGYQFSGSTRGAGRIASMLREIAHRGPDDEGIALVQRESEQVCALRTDDSAAGVDLPHRDAGDFVHDVALGHRRFSIVDLSHAGHQPFVSSDGRVCLTFNGEIYNYVELRDELRALGHEFATGTDTEVLAAAYVEWGICCLSRLVGFFAIALYDADRRRVLLARDRLGQAPLYVARTSEGVVWCSEIKGLVAAAGSPGFAVREQAVSDFVCFGHRDVHDLTFYDGIATFPAASYAWLEPGSGAYRPWRYWRLPGRRLGSHQIEATEAAEQLRETLSEAVRVRMRADVEVAFELSGGLDSSSLCGIAAQSGASLRAYTVEFPGTDAGEVPFARSVADRFADRIDLQVIESSADDFLDSCDEFVALLGEPFHSPNLRTNQDTWRRMRSDGVRVSINGAGGDELFAGYGDYLVAYVGDLLARGKFGSALREVCALSDKPARPLSLRAGYRVMTGLRNEIGRRFAGLSQAWAHRGAVRSLARPGLRLSVPPMARPAAGTDELLRQNVGPWLMNYWLRSGHQSFMGVPIEVRTPFLDHRVVELAFRLPIEFLIRDGFKKWILRRAMEPVLPADIVWRGRKSGFPFPYREWFSTQRVRLFELLRGLDCPFVDLAELERHYGELAARDPLYLWRVISVALWFKRCVLGEALGARRSIRPVREPSIVPT